MKKNLLIYFIIPVIFVIAVLSLKEKNAQESIIYFPIDPTVSFQSASTSLNLLSMQNVKQYSLKWTIESTIDRDAYLRQDVGLLFSNGRLMDGLGKWVEHSKAIKQEKNLSFSKSALYQAITFHHAELHEKGNKIYSAQTMSKDHVYIIQTPFESLTAFRDPSTIEEKLWKERLDKKTNQFLYNNWEKAIKTFSINMGKYHPYPLTNFYFQINDNIPGFSKKETRKLVGSLWEGLYKNYFLGIKKEDGTVESSIGSTIPLILLAKDKSHLIVLTVTAKGEPIILRQRIEDVH